jgi:predicted permease
MAWFRRLSNLGSRAKVDREIENELRAHIELRIADNIATGMSKEEARRDAMLRFGNLTATRERVNEIDAALTLSSVWTDVRYGMRQLRRSPGFTAVALIMLGLGIGANTAIFSLIDAALLKMLPVRDPQQLVQMLTVNPDTPVNDAFSYTAYRAFGERTQVFDGVLAFRRMYNVDFEVDGHGGLANLQLVSGNYFSVLGVNAILGRTLLAADEGAEGESPVAVIGYDYWRSRFGLDPRIIGKRILLNNAAYTVVGVTEPEFYGVQPGERMDVSVPLTTIPLVNPGFAGVGLPYDVFKAPYRNWLFVMARLKPGMTPQEATANLEPVFAQSMREAADGLAGLPIDSPTIRRTILATRLRIDPASQGLAALRNQFSKPLLVVMVIVGLLLLVTCANVANLLLARAQAREKEIAVRLAMGAARLRLMRQLITESALLGLGGGVLGIGLALWGGRWLLVLMAHGRSPVSLSVHADWTVLGFTLAVSSLTVLLFGIIPAWRATRLNPAKGLAQGSRGTRTAGNRSRLAKSLVVVQIAVSLVLLIAAGLLTRSLGNLRSFYPGFNKDKVLLFALNQTMVGYKDGQTVPLYERILARIHAIPGVMTASLSVHEPLSTNVSSTSVKVKGTPAGMGEDLTSIGVEPVGPEYFATLQTPLVGGREFTSADRAGAPKVAVVNESFAHHYFGDANPIGRFVSIPGYRGDADWLEIVGEAHDLKVHDLREPATPMLYVSMLQAPEFGATFEVRTAMNPETIEPAVLNAMNEIDSRLPVFRVKTLSDQLDDSLVEERLVASLSGIFGVLALLLACIGLYGLMAYAVNRRTGEIGLRMALGAERARIAGMIVRETLLLAGCGLVIGVPVAAFASRLMASQLFGVKPGDPLTIAGASVLMGAVTVVASYLPARRAASVDPMQALRSE